MRNLYLYTNNTIGITVIIKYYQIINVFDERYKVRAFETQNTVILSINEQS